MRTKAEIVGDWLPRYTGRSLDQFGRYILLTNFTNYVEMFAQRFGAEILGRDRPMQSATAENLTILNFGMGSAMAATVMDLLAAVEPRAVLFLGKCGGLKKTGIGDFILPIAAIRGEGTSNDYLPPEIPALKPLREAIRREHKVTIAYSDGKGAASTRTIWPIAIGFFEGRQVAVAWCELMTRDPHAALSFYDAVFGWDAVRDPSTGYSTLRSGDVTVGGLLPMPDEVPPQAPSHWQVYFGTDDLEGSVGEVIAAGGQVLRPPAAVAGFRFAIVADPCGATFGLLSGRAS